MEKAEMILLFSGGVDSYAAWLYLNKPPTVYFNTRNRYWKNEIQTVTGLIPSTIIDTSLDLKDREIGEKAYIPARNLLFATQAMKYSDSIVIAGLRDDKVSDKNESVFQEFSNLLTKLEGRTITVMSPFFHMSKSEVVKWVMRKHPDEVHNLVYRTMSCYTEGRFYCGLCPACYRKWCALAVNGINDRYEFYNSTLVETYFRKALLGEYDQRRCFDIMWTTEKYYPAIVKHVVKG